MSHYQTEIGYMVKVLKQPFKDYEEYSESKIYDELRGLGVYLNYDLTLSRVVIKESDDVLDGCIFPDNDVNYTKAITAFNQVEKFNIELHGNLKPFVCSWYNGSDNPSDEISLDRFNKLQE